MYRYVTDFKLWLECKGNTKLREEYKLFIKPSYTQLESKPEFKFEPCFKSKQLASTTVETRIRIVTSFYKYNDIVYQPIERADIEPTTLAVNDGVPTKEEIREILKVCERL